MMESQDAWVIQVKPPGGPPRIFAYYLNSNSDAGHEPVEPLGERSWLAPGAETRAIELFIKPNVFKDTSKKHDHDKTPSYSVYSKRFPIQHWQFCVMAFSISMTLLMIFKFWTLMLHIGLLIGTCVLFNTLGNACTHRLQNLRKLIDSFKNWKDFRHRLASSFKHCLTSLWTIFSGALLVVLVVGVSWCLFDGFGEPDDALNFVVLSFFLGAIPILWWSQDRGVVQLVFVCLWMIMAQFCVFTNATSHLSNLANLSWPFSSRNNATGSSNSGRTQQDSSASGAFLVAIAVLLFYDIGKDILKKYPGQFVTQLLLKRESTIGYFMYVRRDREGFCFFAGVEKWQQMQRLSRVGCPRFHTFVLSAFSRVIRAPIVIISFNSAMCLKAWKTEPLRDEITVFLVSLDEYGVPVSTTYLQVCVQSVTQRHESSRPEETKTKLYLGECYSQMRRRFVTVNLTNLFDSSDQQAVVE